MRLIVLPASIVISMLIAPPVRDQAAPPLERMPVAANVARLDFNIDIRPELVVHLSGCLATFDTDASQVVCINPASGAIRRFGRSGSGPGEFRSVGPILPTADGGLLVFDPVRNLRFTVITPAWTLDRIIPETTPVSSIFRPTPDSVFALGGVRGSDLVRISLHDGGIAVHASPGAADSTGIFRGPQPYDNGFWMVPRRAGGWYVVSPWQYRILVEDDHGRRESSFGRDLPPEQETAREVATFRAAMTRANPGVNIEGLLARWAKEPKPAINAAPVEDGTGRLWLITGRIRNDSTEVDVFDPTGHLLGTRRIPGNAQAVAAQGADLYFVVEYLGGADDGERGIIHYRIR